MFKVCAKRCNQCLFTDNKIVSDERKEEVLDECVRNDSHFICHKHDDVCCRGFYDEDPGATNLMRIMGRLNGIEFVEEEKK